VVAEAVVVLELLFLHPLCQRLIDHQHVQHELQIHELSHLPLVQGSFHLLDLRPGLNVGLEHPGVEVVGMVVEYHPINVQVGLDLLGYVD